MLQDLFVGKKPCHVNSSDKMSIVIKVISVLCQEVETKEDVVCSNVSRQQKAGDRCKDAAFGRELGELHC